MIAYASRTGTRRNLQALAHAGWRILVSAAGSWRSEGLPYAIDNGAWTAFARGVPFDERPFVGVLERMGSEADFIVVPDIVLGGMASLRFSESWIPRLEPLRRPLLLPVQNGMTRADIGSLLGSQIGIFVGGDTPWKEQTLPLWGNLAAAVGCHLHVGRVNSARRIQLCARAGAHSIDGSSASRYAESLPLLDRAVRTWSAQLPLRWL